MPLVEQELPTLPEHLLSPPGFSRVRVTQSLVFSVVFCKSFFVLVVLFLLAFVLSVLLRLADSEPLWYLQTLLMVLAHWNNSPNIDMLLILNTLLWFRANQSLHILLNAVCLVEKPKITISYSLVRTHDLPYQRRANPRSTIPEAIEPTIYHTRGERTHDLPYQRRANPRSTIPEASEPTIYHTRGERTHDLPYQRRAGKPLPHRYDYIHDEIAF